MDKPKHKETPLEVVIDYMREYMPGDSHADAARRLIAAMQAGDAVTVEHLLLDLTTAVSQIVLRRVGLAAAEAIIGDRGDDTYFPERGWDGETPDELGQLIVEAARDPEP